MQRYQTKTLGERVEESFRRSIQKHQCLARVGEALLLISHPSQSQLFFGVFRLQNTKLVLYSFVLCFECLDLLLHFENIV